MKCNGNALEPVNLQTGIAVTGLQPRVPERGTQAIGSTKSITSACSRTEISSCSTTETAGRRPAARERQHHRLVRRRHRPRDAQAEESAGLHAGRSRRQPRGRRRSGPGRADSSGNWLSLPGVTGGNTLRGGSGIGEWSIPDRVSKPNSGHGPGGWNYHDQLECAKRGLYRDSRWQPQWPALHLRRELRMRENRPLGDRRRDLLPTGCHWGKDAGRGQYAGHAGRSFAEVMKIVRRTLAPGDRIRVSRAPHWRGRQRFGSHLKSQLLRAIHS